METATKKMNIRKMPSSCEPLMLPICFGRAVARITVISVMTRYFCPKSCRMISGAPVELTKSAMATETATMAKESARPLATLNTVMPLEDSLSSLDSEAETAVSG